MKRYHYHGIHSTIDWWMERHMGFGFPWTDHVSDVIWEILRQMDEWEPLRGHIND